MNDNFEQPKPPPDDLAAKKSSNLDINTTSPGELARHSSEVQVIESEQTQTIRRKADSDEYTELAKRVRRSSCPGEAVDWEIVKKLTVNVPEKEQVDDLTKVSKQINDNGLKRRRARARILLAPLALVCGIGLVITGAVRDDDSLKSGGFTIAGAGLTMIAPEVIQAIPGNRQSQAKKDEEDEEEEDAT